MAMTAWAAKFLTSSICLSGEWANLLAKNIHRTDELVILQQRNSKRSSKSAEFNRGDDKWMVLDVGLELTEVGDMDDLLRARDAPKWRIRCRSDRWVALARFDVSGRRVVSSSNRAEGVAIVQVQYSEPSLANTCCVREHRFEHRLQLAGRAADDLQHLGRRRQLLQRLVPLTCEPRDICFLAGSEGTTTPCRLWRIAALQRLRRCVFASLPPALSRRLIASPEAQDKAS